MNSVSLLFLTFSFINTQVESSSGFLGIVIHYSSVNNDMNDVSIKNFTSRFYVCLPFLGISKSNCGWSLGCSTYELMVVVLA